MVDRYGLQGVLAWSLDNSPDRLLRNGVGESLGRASGTMNKFPSAFLTNKSASSRREKKRGEQRLPEWTYVASQNEQGFSYDVRLVLTDLNIRAIRTFIILLKNVS